MTTLLSVLAIVLSVLAIFAYQWVTLVPRLGIGALYHLRRVRLGVALAALALAAAAYLLNPSPAQIVVIVLVVLLTPLSGANQARRILVALDDPPHVAADKATLGGAAQVLGVVVDGTARAYPLEILVPHHIINDRVGLIPAMAAW